MYEAVRCVLTQPAAFFVRTVSLLKLSVVQKLNYMLSLAAREALRKLD